MTFSEIVTMEKGTYVSVRLKCPKTNKEKRHVFEENCLQIVKIFVQNVTDVVE
jgi:hypothetical protein